MGGRHHHFFLRPQASTDLLLKYYQIQLYGYSCRGTCRKIHKTETSNIVRSLGQGAARDRASERAHVDDSFARSHSPDAGRMSGGIGASSGSGYLTELLSELTVVEASDALAAAPTAMATPLLPPPPPPPPSLPHPPSHTPPPAQHPNAASTAHGWRRYTDDWTLWLQSRQHSRRVWEAEKQRVVSKLVLERVRKMSTLLLGAQDPACSLHCFAGHQDVLRKIDGHLRRPSASLPPALSADINAFHESWNGMDVSPRRSECVDPPWLTRLKGPHTMDLVPCRSWRLMTASDGASTWVRRS